MLYVVEHAGAAFVSSKDVPSSQWREISKHRKLRNAVLSLEREYRKMKRFCSPTGWSDTFRISVDGDEISRTEYEEMEEQIEKEKTRNRW